ncbi:hypothetical protein QLX08_006112 [Tetragonisca angustula]|uniref:Uncharacterized protein n=1 Tax=Tetragonisca angustula TaxID=166442 RepID=A0AAW0ZXW5_9HYME
MAARWSIPQKLSWNRKGGFTLLVVEAHASSWSPSSSCIRRPQEASSIGGCSPGRVAGNGDASSLERSR